MSWNEEIQLYKELLKILQEESQALAQADEGAMLKLAAAKEELLNRLTALTPAEDRPGNDSEAHRAASTRLKQQIAAANQRNHELIAASLEVIQDFLAQFTPPGPGSYRPAGQAAASPGEALFSRQV